MKSIKLLRQRERTNQGFPHHKVLLLWQVYPQTAQLALLHTLSEMNSFLGYQVHNCTIDKVKPKKIITCFNIQMLSSSKVQLAFSSSHSSYSFFFLLKWKVKVFIRRNTRRWRIELQVEFFHPEIWSFQTQ